MRNLFYICFVTFVVITAGFADESSLLTQVSDIEVAIKRGTEFLVEQQETDGTWRSKQYGLLKDGTSLTPLVLISMAVSPSSRVAFDRGMEAISDWIVSDGGQARIRSMPQYPVYSAGLIVRLLNASQAANRGDQLSAWRNLLVNHQLAENNGWSPRDWSFGGWGYTHDPPTRPIDGSILSPLDQPNLSATVFALEGIIAGNMLDPEKVAIQQNALRFVERCQNWRENALAADQKYNDGGFHFILHDEVRNKPGVAGIDNTGETRFHSYGSATADGLRSLLLCGMSPDHPRVIAARQWLIQRFRDGEHPGAYPDDRRPLQPSLSFYYLASATKAFRQMKMDDTELKQARWARLVANRLLALQLQTGAWVNPAVDVREDDPLIATSFALSALSDCLNELHEAR